MRLEELLAMSDRELNELAAKVMGNGHIVPEAGYFDTTHQYPHYALWMNGVFYMRGPEDSWPWEPATDLNQAWELVNREGFWGYPCPAQGMVYANKDSWERDKVRVPMPVEATSSNVARALTIAAILASEVTL